MIFTIPTANAHGDHDVLIKILGSSKVYDSFYDAIVAVLIEIIPVGLVFDAAKLSVDVPHDCFVFHAFHRFSLHKILFDDKFDTISVESSCVLLNILHVILSVDSVNCCRFCWVLCSESGKCYDFVSRLMDLLLNQDLRRQLAVLRLISCCVRHGCKVSVKSMHQIFSLINSPSLLSVPLLQCIATMMLTRVSYCPTSNFEGFPSDVKISSRSFPSHRFIFGVEGPGIMIPTPQPWPFAREFHLQLIFRELPCVSSSATHLFTCLSSSGFGIDITLENNTVVVSLADEKSGEISSNIPDNASVRKGVWHCLIVKLCRRRFGKDDLTVVVDGKNCMKKNVAAPLLTSDVEEFSFGRGFCGEFGPICLLNSIVPDSLLGAELASMDCIDSVNAEACNMADCSDETQSAVYASPSTLSDKRGSNSIQERSVVMLSPAWSDYRVTFTQKGCNISPGYALLGNCKIWDVSNPRRAIESLGGVMSLAPAIFRLVIEKWEETLGYFESLKKEVFCMSGVQDLGAQDHSTGSINSLDGILSSFLFVFSGLLNDYLVNQQSAFVNQLPRMIGMAFSCVHSRLFLEEGVSLVAYAIALSLDSLFVEFSNQWNRCLLADTSIWFKCTPKVFMYYISAIQTRLCADDKFVQAVGPKLCMNLIDKLSKCPSDNVLESLRHCLKSTERRNSLEEQARGLSCLTCSMDECLSADCNAVAFYQLCVTQVVVDIGTHLFTSAQVLASIKSGWSDVIVSWLCESSDNVAALLSDVIVVVLFAGVNQQGFELLAYLSDSCGGISEFLNCVIARYCASDCEKMRCCGIELLSIVMNFCVDSYGVLAKLPVASVISQAYSVLPFMESKRFVSRTPNRSNSRSRSLTKDFAIDSDMSAAREDRGMTIVEGQPTNDADMNVATTTPVKSRTPAQLVRNDEIVYSITAFEANRLCVLTDSNFNCDLEDNRTLANSDRSLVFLRSGCLDMLAEIIISKMATTTQLTFLCLLHFCLSDSMATFLCNDASMAINVHTNQSTSFSLVVADRKDTNMMCIMGKLSPQTAILSFGHFRLILVLLSVAGSELSEAITGDLLAIARFSRPVCIQILDNPSWMPILLECLISKTHDRQLDDFSLSSSNLLSFLAASKSICDCYCGNSEVNLTKENCGNAFSDPRIFSLLHPTELVPDCQSLGVKSCVDLNYDLSCKLIATILSESFRHPNGWKKLADFVSLCSAERISDYNEESAGNRQVSIMAIICHSIREVLLYYAHEIGQASLVTIPRQEFQEFVTKNPMMHNVIEWFMASSFTVIRNRPLLQGLLRRGLEDSDHFSQIARDSSDSLFSRKSLNRSRIFQRQESSLAYGRVSGYENSLFSKLTSLQQCSYKCSDGRHELCTKLMDYCQNCGHSLTLHDVSHSKTAFTMAATTCVHEYFTSFGTPRLFDLSFSDIGDIDQWAWFLMKNFSQTEVRFNSSPSNESLNDDVLTITVPIDSIIACLLSFDDAWELHPESQFASNNNDLDLDSPDTAVAHEDSVAIFLDFTSLKTNSKICMICEDLVTREKNRNIEFVSMENRGTRIVHVVGPSVLAHVVETLFASCLRNASELDPPKSNSSVDNSIMQLVYHSLALFDSICWKDDQFLEGNRSFLSCTVSFIERESVVLTALRLSLFLLSSTPPTSCESLKIVSRLRGIYSCIESFEGKFAARPLWMMLVFCHVFEALWHIRLSMISLLHILGFDLTVPQSSPNSGNLETDYAILEEFDRLLEGVDAIVRRKRIVQLARALMEGRSLASHSVSSSDDEPVDVEWSEFIEKMKKVKEAVRMRQATDQSRIDVIESFGSRWQEFINSVSQEENKYQLVCSLMSSPEAVVMSRYCRLLTFLLMDVFQQNVTMFASSLGQIDYLAVNRFCEKYRGLHATEVDPDNASYVSRENMMKWMQSHSQVALLVSPTARGEKLVTFSSQQSRVFILDRLSFCLKVLADPLFDIDLLKVGQVAEAVSYLDSKEGEVISSMLARSGNRLAEINELANKTVFMSNSVGFRDSPTRVSINQAKTVEGTYNSLACVSSSSNDFVQGTADFDDLRWRGSLALWRRMMRKYRNGWSPWSVAGSSTMHKVSSHRDPLLRRLLLVPKYCESSLPECKSPDDGRTVSNNTQSFRSLFWFNKREKLSSQQNDTTCVVDRLDSIVKDSIISSFPVVRITRRSKIFGELGLSATSIYFRALKVEGRLAPSCVSSDHNCGYSVDDDSDEEDEGEVGHVLWDFWIRYDKDGQAARQRVRCDEHMEQASFIFLSKAAVVVGPNAIWRISLRDILCILGRRLFLAPCAIEIFTDSHCDAFFAFSNERERKKFITSLKSLRMPSLERSILMSPIESFESSEWTAKWHRGEITNYEYIVRLNQFAGRSINDLSQYLVFPWVLSYFEGDNTVGRSLRDLSKPIGALNETRLAEFYCRVTDLFQDAADNPDYDLVAYEDNQDRFMYGSHYSNSGIVLHYLLRQEPYTSLNLDVQGGKFDHGDRLFYDVKLSWKSACESMTDVKELIPEFFYFPEMFLNSNNLQLGVLQESKIVVNDVVLPGVIDSDPYKYVELNLEALESDDVSRSLNLWIDLVFGCRQRGLPALKASNLFHCLTYEGSIELDSIEDPNDRNAIKDQIMFYGQTPSQLLTEPHPERGESKDFSCLLCSSEEYAKHIAIFYPARQLVESPSDNPLMSRHGAVLSLDSFLDKLVVVYQDLFVASYKVNPTVDVEGNPIDVKLEKIRPLQCFPQLVWSQFRSSIDFNTRDQSCVTIKKSSSRTESSPPATPRKDGRKSIRQTISSLLSRAKSDPGPEKIEEDEKELRNISSAEGSINAESVCVAKFDVNAIVLLRGPIASVGGTRWTTSSGRIVVYGFLDGSIRFYELTLGREVCRAVGHADRVTCCSLHSDSPNFVSGDKGGVLRFWSVESSKDNGSGLMDTEVLENLSQFESCSFLKETAVPPSNVLPLFSPIHCVHSLHCHISRAMCVHYDSYSDIIVSASEDGAIAVHEALRGKFVGLIDYFIRGVVKPSIIKTDSNGRIYVHCWRNYSLHIFSVNGHHLREVGLMQRIITMELTSNSKILICGRDDGGISFRMTSDLRQVHLVEACSHGAICAVGFSDARHILIGSLDGNFGVCYDAELTVRMIKTAIDMSMLLSNEKGFYS